MTETDPFEDRPLYGTGDLAVFLGGSEDSFTGLLLVLFQKADPGNLERLRLGFPEVAAAWETWNAMSPAPTPGQLLEALALRPADEPRATAVALLERMSEVRGHIEDMDDDERAFMLGALTGALEAALGG